MQTSKKKQDELARRRKIKEESKFIEIPNIINISDVFNRISTISFVNTQQMFVNKIHFFLNDPGIPINTKNKDVFGYVDFYISIDPDGGNVIKFVKEIKVGDNILSMETFINAGSTIFVEGHQVNSPVNNITLTMTILARYKL